LTIVRGFAKGKVGEEYLGKTCPKCKFLNTEQERYEVYLEDYL
jgi:phage FluMu protein Com